MVEWLRLLVARRSIMRFLHGGLANALSLFTIIAALWGMLSAIRRKGVDSNYWGILAVAEIIVLVQALLGGLLYAGGNRPGSGVHILYGALVVFSLPLYYSLSKGRNDRRAAIIYSLICLFMFAMSLRAIMTSGPL
jgi:heme A synthase